MTDINIKIRLAIGGWIMRVNNGPELVYPSMDDCANALVREYGKEGARWADYNTR